MLPSDFTHIQDETNTRNDNRTSRPSFSGFHFSATPEPSEHDVSRNHSTAAYSTTELNSRTWIPTPEPSTPMEDKPRSDSTTLCSISHPVRIRKEPIVTERAVEEDFEGQQPPSFPRKVCAVIFDLIAAVFSLCFILFAMLAYMWDETPASEYKARALLGAGRIGPTVFPIVFCLILARCLTAVANWRLQRGATVGLLEYLVSGRSFASTIMAPSKVKSFHIMFPALIILWALSPIGGQSALRIVTLEPFSTISLSTIQYLNTRISQSSFVNNATASQDLQNTNAAFNAALLSASTLRNGTQDIFGNLQIPMLEAAVEQGIASADGWYDVSNVETPTYTSLFGIPFASSPWSANTTFIVETSYIALDCTTASKALDLSSSTMNTTDLSSGYISNGRNLGVSIDPGRTASSEQALRIDFHSVANTSASARLTNAWCNLTTTSIEASVFCNTTGSCAVQAVRDSKVARQEDIIFAIDSNNIGDDVALRFFSAFINATTTPNEQIPASSVIENYIADPSSPFALTPQATALADIDDVIFSRRLAQLLNTYYLASISPTALMGAFASSSSAYAAASAPATLTTAQDVLRCHLAWFIVLILTSGAMFIAACVTAALDLLRRGPDVVDDMKGYLRGSPLVKVVEGRTVEDHKAIVRLTGETMRGRASEGSWETRKEYM